jgi:hypothetical protein
MERPVPGSTRSTPAGPSWTRKEAEN